ncbi:sushi, von Willebrand factor type A, EGF and pentraxin domain-containing protein 1-like [Mizuhopecten yessoensis]|uniref:sushi, von Willebrand factor type A, EGF and pentraxin domain-containing protein 1-like n=1 Tax=Mizuhopecten yessoensis TaxID=6573 RepID=UPI000B45ABE7|nr:sushi, von Willebrand factor type A, EGF and pentraxin domain-containing protein 1-like [Mizuhopecten yessoensis]
MARFSITFLWIAAASISVEATGPKEDMVLRNFQNIFAVSVSANIDLLWAQKTGIKTKLRCASACMELGCSCGSFLYDGPSGGICYMFSKTLSSGSGNINGANKSTECVLPKALSNAILLDYTGCTATYDCEFGYTSEASKDPGKLICQTNETWGPSDYACVEIPCPPPETLKDGTSEVTSLQVGGVAIYTCNSDYINRGGSEDTLTCKLGGAWSGHIDMSCFPVKVMYTFNVRTSDKKDVGKGRDVYVVLTGRYGTTRIDFNINFPRGTTQTFTGSFTDVGSLTRVVVGHNSGNSPPWRLSSVSIIFSVF